jgi:ribonuclease HI
MRVFTDGSCIGNGRKGAKAGYAVWFPEHREWSIAKRVPDEHSQTNQRAELSAIHEAVTILDQKGYYDEDIVIYTDSDYSINCLTKWIPGWVSRNWKTAEGKDVLHQDLIRSISDTLTKFKSHRFHHVRAHTGGGDDLSVNNDIVDRMARGTVEEVKVIEPPAVDQLFEGCPLQLMGPPVPADKLMTWIRENLDTLDKDIFNKHLLKAFIEQCKLKEVNITKQTLQKQLMYRAERVNLQVSKVVIEKIE